MSSYLVVVRRHQDPRALAVIFDLGGTLVDTVLRARLWRRGGLRIHRRIGMSGGLFTRAGAFRFCRDPQELRESLDELGLLP